MGLSNLRIIRGSVMRGSKPKYPPKTELGKFIQNYMDEHNLFMSDLQKMMNKTQYSSSYASLARARSGEVAHFDNNDFYLALAEVTGYPSSYIKSLNDPPETRNVQFSARVLAIAEKLEQYSEAKLDLIDAHIRFLESEHI